MEKLSNLCGWCVVLTLLVGATAWAQTTYPVPQIANPLVPTAVVPGSPAFTLTVNGNNFVPASTVNWNGNALNTTYVNASQLTASVPEFEVVTSTASVTVTTPTPGGGTSTGLSFNVNNENLPPTITIISPTTTTVGEAFTLVVNGTNFVPTSTVNWNGDGLNTTYVSDIQLTASVPASDVTPAGTASVTVTSPTPGGGTTSGVTCTISNLYPSATISSLSPGSGTAGDPAFTLTVNGSNFVPASIVNWNGMALDTTYVSASQLTASVPISDVASAGTAGVTVTNPSPGGGTSTASNFTINGANLIPTISSLSPSGVTAGGGPITLTVNGSKFVPSSTVLWNGSALATSYLSDTQLTATIPASDIASAGASSANVTVMTPTGTGVVFTAMELTDIVPMTVTISNVRNSGATFDVIITHGNLIETYRGVQLAGTSAQLPAAMINKLSALVQVAPAAAGYGTAITAQQLSLTYGLPANLVTCFSAADFIEGDESTIAVFEPNSKLDNVEIFNLLMVPGVTDFSIISAALAFAERKRAFVIIDPPPQAPAFGSSIATPQPIQYWMEGLYGPSGPVLPLSQNGAIYFPYLTSNDPITGNNIPIAPSGFVAGIYAQTDANRGVWKAPAGLATVVLNTVGPVLSGAMNDPQQGVLNLESINCLRSFSGIGTVVWGSRTLVAANAAYQQWMYVPVRRMTLFIEQTLLANLRWVVFEPNDEPLWIAITASISAFLLSLFRQGALQGSTPSEAFQVKCDSTTTTAAAQATGIVNIVVAFAPLKPAEFVIIQIAQLAGQTAGS